MFSSFFLGANSGRGFHSFYKELINTKEAECTYILKGGPGSGKSSLMRRVAECAEKRGLSVEKIYCSSDPASLDAVILTELKIAIADGTSPHIIEPDFPLVTEQYINLGQFADIEKIKSSKDEIIETKCRYSAAFERVYGMCACAEKIDDELFDIALAGLDTEYLKKRAHGIVKREIRGKGNGADLRRRFCEAISSTGFISLLTERDEEPCKTYIIEDSYGLSHFILSEIKSAALASEFACIACFSPLKPTQMVHLFIPELKLAFVTSTRDCPIDMEYHRKIRIDPKVESSLDVPLRARLRRLRKMRKLFISEAAERLKDAKLIHDELENLYNPYINFEALYSFADELCLKIFD